MSSSKFGLLVVLIFGSLYTSVLSQSPRPKAVIQIRPSPVERVYNPDFRGKPEQQIEMLEHQLSDALKTKDDNALGRLLSDRVLISGVIGDLKQIIALSTKLDQTKYTSIEKSEMRIQIHGDTAIATGIQKAYIDIENGSRMSQTIFINTWRRTEGTWQCIAMGS